MGEQYCNPRTRSRKLWDKHGSWLILVVVIGFAFNAGVEWEGMKRAAIVREIVNAGIQERDALRQRVRAANDENRKLTAQIPKTIQKADEAVKKADELIQKTEATK